MTNDRPRRFLNVGCGGKFHSDWENIDFYPRHPSVRRCDILSGLEYPDESFDVVYHSQVLEHIPKERAAEFIGECARVLKPGGILRVVVPDLENIAREYLRCLESAISSDSRESAANYDWVLLELLDQMVRPKSGGEMAKYLAMTDLPNEPHILERTGAAGEQALAYWRSPPPAQGSWLFRVARELKRKVQPWLSRLGQSEATRLGRFRLAGEVHLWMYDRYSLPKLIAGAGLINVAIRSPFESAILDWNGFELDVRNGRAIDPTSLFVEAEKPGASS